MIPIITLQNVKTREKALVYREVFNSAVKVLGGQELRPEMNSCDASNDLFVHVKYMSELINNCLRGRVNLMVQPPE